MSTSMTRLFVIQNISRLDDKQLAEAIANSLVTLQELPKFLPSISSERLSAIEEQISYALVEEDYEEVCKLNTIDAYQSFIAKYPDNPLEAKAQEAINQLQEGEIKEAWELCEQHEEPSLYEDFIKRYPKCRYAAKAHKYLEEYRWKTCDQNDAQALRNYMDIYPNGKYYAIASAIIEEINHLAQEEERVWQLCIEREEVSDYESYIRLYPQGKHIAEARITMDQLLEQQKKVKETLFMHMRYNPELYSWGYVADILRIGEVQFQGEIIRVSAEELIENGLISRNALNYIASGISFDQKEDQKNFQDLPALPIGGTDVYFFGIPASGKSTVLSAILTLGNQTGTTQYKPNMINGIDPSISYYETLTTALRYQMLPPRTLNDTCNTMGIDLYTPDYKRFNPLSFVEIGGEYFVSATQDISGTVTSIDVASHGATAYLCNDNRKLLFFLIDYSKVVETDSKLEIQQKQCLERVLHIFSHQPIFSKTDTICVIVTKADKMGVSDPEERFNIALQYLENKHKAFMQGLTKICQNFGINKEVSFQPIVMTFSIGEVGIGDTVSANYQDAEILLNFIRNHSRARKTAPSFFERLINAFKN